MATLTGTKPRNTYKDLLQVSNSNSGIDGTLRSVEDGEGTTGPFKVSTSGVEMSQQLDLNGKELILDADGDSSLHSNVDDQIDVRLAGSDDFTFTPNTFTALSGSTVTIASGATITNSGTANGFDVLSAASGVLQTNAGFISQCIFGPSIDGAAWNGAWTKSGVYSSLMLATIEDEGSNTEINIWDLTEETAGVISTTPLATVDLASAATPTSIAASMGYLIIGSEDGIAIVDPHSGAWAERTDGWPKTLSTSTAPALDSNDVVMVAAAVVGVSPLDPRTGGSLPTFACLYASGESKTASLIKFDGNVWDITNAAPATGVVGFQGEDFIFPRDATDTRRFWASRINADFASTSGSSYADSDAWPQGFAATTAFSASDLYSAWASTSGLGVRIKGDNEYKTGIASINRTYNTGYLVSDIRGAWLANSKTADRSYKGNTLTENGTVTEAVVESGAELKGYSGFSASNNLTRASDADWDQITTGSVVWSYWFKSTGASAAEVHVGFKKSDSSIRFDTYLNSDGTLVVVEKGATAQATITTTATYEDSAWHKVDWVRYSSTDRSLYVDGVLVASNTTDTGSLSSSGNLPLAIGVDTDGSSYPAANTTLSLVRLNAYSGPPASLVREMYEGEKGMFVANAECLLQSGSADAVLDVSVDPLTNKILVTQTDAITVFKKGGLVVDSKPSVNSGSSEKGKLWGDLRAEQNSANAYVTAPATDQRQINEMVRSLANDLPAGPDLSKAKAYLKFDQNTNSIKSSINIKSVTDVTTGRAIVYFGVPFVNDDYVIAGSSKDVCFVSTALSTGAAGGQFPDRIEQVRVVNTSGANVDNIWEIVVFGELENE